MLNIGDTVTSGTAVFKVKSYKKAEALEAARSITLNGDINGTVDFDGSEDVTINTSFNADSVSYATVIAKTDDGNIILKLSDGSSDGGGGDSGTADTVVATDEDINKIVSKFSDDSSDSSDDTTNDDDEDVVVATTEDINQISSKFA